MGYTYDDANHTATAVSSRSSDGKELSTTVTKFDSRGHKILESQSGDAGGKAEVVTRKWEYDTADRLESETDPLERKTTYGYDPASSVRTATNALGQQIALTYDGLGRVTLTEMKDLAAAPMPVRRMRTEYSRDHAGAVNAYATTGIEESGGRVTKTTTYTDHSGRVVCTRLADGKFTRQVYDLAGNLAETVDTAGRQAWSYYDGANRLSYRVEADGAATAFNYDEQGRLVGRVMPNGMVWATDFDSAGRVQWEELRGTAGIVQRKDFAWKAGARGGLLDSLTEVVSSAEGERIIRSPKYDDWWRPSGSTVTWKKQAQELKKVDTTLTLDFRGLAETISQDTSTANELRSSSKVSRIFSKAGELKDEHVELQTDLEALKTVPKVLKTISRLGQSRDKAGRRREVWWKADGASLPNEATPETPTLTFGYRADGLMTSVTESVNLSEGTYGFAWGLDGRPEDRGATAARHNPWRSVSMRSSDRDERGRPLAWTHTLGNVTVAESALWNGDNTLQQYSYKVAANAPLKWDYSYDGQLPGAMSAQGRARLTKEQLPSNNSALFEFDAGKVGGLGVRTRARFLDEASLPVWETMASGAGSGAALQSPDAFGRVKREVNAGGVETLKDEFDERGYIRQRKWTDSSGTVREQTLEWDALGRLTGVDQTGTNASGTKLMKWQAYYDGLNRRIQTVETSDGVVRKEESTFDPTVEFMELRLKVAWGVPGAPPANEKTFWLIHGPNGRGVYGAMQGLHGLEAIVEENGTDHVGVIADILGNIVGHRSLTDPNATEPKWHAAVLTAYGPAPGEPLPQVIDAKSLAEALAWRGRRSDPTGLYWLGARYYDPEHGRFISPDPLGHEATLDLYSFANGDPVNYFDPDGRCARKALGDAGRYFGGLGSVLQQMKDETSHMLVNLPETGKSLWGAASAIPGAVSYAYSYYGNGPVAQDLNGLGMELTAYGTYLANNPDQIAGSIGQGVAVVGSLVSPGGLAGRANTVTKAGRLVNGIEELANAGEEIVNLADETIKVVVDNSYAEELAARGGAHVLTQAEKALYGRVTHPKGFRQEVWERAKAPDGNVYDPTGRILKYDEPWELGHNTANKFSNSQLRAAQEGWDRQMWIRYQNDPDIYRPELPSTNASHQWE